LIPKSPAEISARTRRLIMEMEQGEDRVEGQAAFREKRKPRFTGR
jgi:1,4-dihydroxy-2-naphthoyl-CoA synthase